MKKLTRFSPSCWFSPSQMNNFALSNTLEDYLNLYVDIVVPPAATAATAAGATILQDKSEEEKSKLRLFEQGIEFEKIIIQSIKDKLKPHQYTTIIDSSLPLDWFSSAPEYFEKTKQCLKKGFVCIFQCPLFYPNNSTYGIADVVIRSDYLNKLTNKSILSNQMK